jgi:hypothetical protein
LFTVARFFVLNVINNPTPCILHKIFIPSVFDAAPMLKNGVGAASFFAPNAKAQTIFS